jgi:two-component system, response regulator, stage 0 sporulation protein F
MAHDKSKKDNLAELAAPCILVADDDRDMREEVSEALRREGYLAIAFESGDQLIEYVRGSVVSEGRVRMPDVIVSDVRMPGCTGFEVLKAVREIPCDAPVVLMTAFGDPEIHREAQQRGAIVTLDKPFEADALRDAMLTALRR